MKLRNEDNKVIALSTPSDTQIKVITRINAQRDYVFKLWTDRNIIPKWWANSNTKTTVEEMNLEINGRWKFKLEGETGKQVILHGLYKEVVSPEYVKWTFNFGEGTTKEFEEKIEFIPVDRDKTDLVTNMSFKSKEHRDAMLTQMGFESGLAIFFERFKTLIKTMDI